MKTNGRVIPTDAVVARGRFRPGGPDGFIIRPPFGDGSTLYASREEAMDAAAEGTT